MRRGWLLAVAVVVLGGGGALLAGLARSTDDAAPGASVSASVAPSAVAPSAVPVPGTTGDGYRRNVTAGDTCSPAGALGFTTQGRPVQCASTAADATPRWRTP